MTPQAPTRSWSIALLLLLTGFGLQTGFQTMTLAGKRLTLMRLAAAQAPSLAQSLKTRAQLQFLAGSVAKLAEGGNADAIAVVQAMRQRGIGLKPASAAAAR